VIDRLRGRVKFVQLGSEEHNHPTLDGVINLVGQTDVRHFLRLVYHAEGGLGPITFLQHACAAFEKPYIALLGGRESATWTQYPLQTTFHSIRKLPCCRTQACWRSRVVRLNDGKEQDNSLCEAPVLDMQRPVGKCMAMIRPAEVVRTIEDYYEGGVLGYQEDSSYEPAGEARTEPVNSSKPIHGSPLPEVIAYSDWGFDTKIVPATVPRQWMDALDNGFSYHCLPMVIANQAGWFLLASRGVVAEWNGGPKAEDLRIEALDEPQDIQAVSHVGGGILTWIIPYVFRTPLGWNLLCRGPANVVKDGIAPLEALVETDWVFASFSADWKFTRAGTCRFEAGEPVAMPVPQRRGELEAFAPRLTNLTEDPEMKRGYDPWFESRHEFWEAQKRGESRERFQLHYRRGCSNDGVFYAGHQRSLRLRPFEVKPEPRQSDDDIS
jgi:hypothetical protein